jgi:6-phosphogluconolactonase/glucosamine-6-phosphate isomerase/deaminase
MGLANILQAKRIILLAFGEKKRAAITHFHRHEFSQHFSGKLRRLNISQHSGVCEVMWLEHQQKFPDLINV